MRLDIVSNDAGELVRLEHARDLGSANVQAVYRLLKLVQLHDMGNQAFLRQLEQSHQALVDYGIRAGVNFNVLFASKAVFVGGQLLKGSRQTYDAATELGDILEWCGGSDLTIQKDVTQKDLEVFAQAVGAAMKVAKGTGYKPPTARVRLRPVTDAARFRGLEIEKLTFEQKVVRTYASAVVIMRRFFADLHASRYILPRRIKRVAQSLVDLSDGATPAFLGVTDVRNQNFDDAGRAVNTAILAVSMARELTGDRVLLAQIAMAAMMHDVGRPRAAALGEGGPRMPGPVRLSEDAEDKLAAGTAAVLTALGRVNEPTITRTVVAFEALWLRRERFLGPIYAGGRLPTIHAKIVQIARRYNDLVTPEPGLPEPQPDFAIATIARDMSDEGDRTVLRLLVATLNLLPLGSIVQLTTNEVAELVSSPSGSGTWVSILRDTTGAIVEQPFELDLAAPADPGEAPRRIVRVLSTDGWGQGAEVAPADAQPDSDDPVRQQRAAEAEEPPILEPEPELELEPLDPELDLLETDERQKMTIALGPGELAAQEALAASTRGVDSSPASSSVPSIASILAPGGARARISDAAGLGGPVDPSAYPSYGTSPSNVGQSLGRVFDGVNPASGGTSPSMVAHAMGRAIEDSPPAERRPRSVALFEDPMVDVVAQIEQLEPTARGTLTSTPIVHVLVYMLDHRQTGTVVLREADGRHHVLYFLDGHASMVRNGRPIALLGDGLVASGLLAPDALARAIDLARRDGSLLGTYLTASGLLTHEALRLALHAQVPRKIERVVNLGADTDYAFYAGTNLIPDWANGEIFPCNPLIAIHAAVRSWYDRARVRATLSRIAKQPLTFHPEVDLSGFVLTGEQQAVVDAIHSGSYTLSSLYDLRAADEDTVSSLVYAFAVTRSFAFTASKGPPMVAVAVLETLQEDVFDEPEMDLATAATVPPEPAKRYTSPSSPPTVAVSSSHPLPMPSRDGGDDRDPLRAAKSWPAPTQERRPATLPPRPGTSTAPRGSAPSLAPLRDSQIRKAPPRAAADDDSELLVQAMADFRLAEAAHQRSDNILAEELARKALAAEPANSDYAALVAWLASLSGAKDAIPLAIAKLNVILKDDPGCERALLYRGRLYKRAKRAMEALRDFSAVLEVNPQNSEAASEVRLLRMKKK